MNIDYTYKARVSRVVDGDTLDLHIDQGFRVFSKQRVRLYGIDTPETYGVKKSSEEYEKGKLAQDAVLAWLDDNAPIDAGDPMGKWEVHLRSYDGKQLGVGKYGRWLAVIYPVYDNRTSVMAPLTLNDWLVEAGHAVRKEYG